MRFLGKDPTMQAWQIFRESPNGQAFFHPEVPVGPDGRFQIPDVLPGSYQIFFQRKGEHRNAVVERRGTNGQRRFLEQQAASRRLTAERLGRPLARLQAPA